MDRYQDALLPGQIESGERDCAIRWDQISDHIPSNGVLVDVGSNLGYFGIRTALENPGVAVLSIEADPVIAEKQRDIIEANGCTNVTLVQGAITADACETWSKTCDVVHTTLLLAILHWIDDPARAVRALASMSNQMIVEVPHPKDAGACGQKNLALWEDPVAWFTEVTDRQVRLIGRMERHTSDEPSYVVLIDGPAERKPSVAYWGSTFEHPLGADYRIVQSGSDAELWIRGEAVEVVPGLNLASLPRLGKLLWPPTDTWVRRYEQALSEHPSHTDPLPHNALWTSTGVTFIDDEPGRVRALPSDGMRAWKANLASWESGASAEGSVVVRSLSRTQRFRRTAIGARIADVLPSSVKQAILKAKRAVENRRLS